MGGILDSDTTDPNPGAARRLKEEQATALRKKRQVAKQKAEILKARLGGGGFGSSAPTNSNKNSTLGG